MRASNKRLCRDKTREFFCAFASMVSMTSRSLTRHCRRTSAGDHGTSNDFKEMQAILLPETMKCFLARNFIGT